MTGALALVESPAQLLNTLEWGIGHRLGAGGLPETLRIAVLLPLDDPTRRQLDAMTALARAEGVRVDLLDPRRSKAAQASCAARLAPLLSRTDQRLVLGDPFSRLVQTLLLPLSRSRDTVVVDDGTATLELSELLLRGAPLVRWHSGGSGGQSARRATQRLLPQDGRTLELFTAMAGPVAMPPGSYLSANRYSWARRRFGRPTVLPGTDLAGTSLVETGLVPVERYVDGVARLCLRHGVSRYLAHRRESPAKLELLASAARVEVVRPRLPLELAALTEPIGSTLLSFPSTVLHTLPLVLAGSGVAVVGLDEVQQWLAPDVSPQVAPFLARVSAGAATATPGPAADAADPRSPEVPPR